MCFDVLQRHVFCSTQNPFHFYMCIYKWKMDILNNNNNLWKRIIANTMQPYSSIKRYFILLFIFILFYKSILLYFYKERSALHWRLE